VPLADETREIVRMGETDRPDVVTALADLVSKPAAALYASVLEDPEREVPADEPAARELIDRGLATANPANGTLFVYPPQAALTRALEAAIGSWLAAAPDVAGISATIARAERRLDLPQIAGGKVEDQGERQRVLESLILGATRDIRMIQTFNESSPETFEDDDDWSEMDEGLTSPDVSFRVVYDERLLGIPGFEESVRAEQSMGVEIRLTSERLPSYLLIVDGTTAAYMPRTGGAGEVTTAPGLVGLLEWSFEAIWGRSVQLDPSGDLDPHLHAVFALVGLGRTNRQIASTIGVHERTVRRRVDELLRHFDETDRAALVRRAAIADPTG
jgi:hypothetical protein